MTANGLLQIFLFIALLAAVAKPLGSYMARVYEGRPAWGLGRVLSPVERLIYRLCGVQPEAEMDWKGYALAVLLFSAVGMIALYILQRVQQWLPLNPQHFGAVSPGSALNTAVSFTTNTNWQGYAGEATMSYLTQMAGLAVQNFVSAATGMAVLIALIRGIARRQAATIGNFWVDLTRTTLYILLPLSFVLALVLASQGVVQTLAPYQEARTLETGASQVLAVGPVASQAAIKHLGTNGGGFFNANAAHPFESPTPFTDLLLVFTECAIAAALCYTFGKMVGDTRQGWAILATMLIVLLGFQVFAYWAEARGNPAITAMDVAGGNMEGKEVRFGIARSALFAAATTATSCGAVNAMHDSFTPLGGLVPLALMQFGETILGGVGSGLYGMLVFVIVAVFIAGLMVGRTPEYLGKKIEAYEVKMAALIVLIMPLVVLLFTAVAVTVRPGLDGIANPGAHGFSEILYAYTSQGNNNGSAFAGLAANNPFYNLTGALAMLVSRFWLVIPTLAIAGSLAAKKTLPAVPGTLPTHTPLFVVLLLGVIVLVGALTFFPALALGPIVEHLQMTAGGL
ncbi:MAG: potassium-transporting ATPase subunit KdpA [Thermoanaerobaculia bacterium]